MNSLKKEGSDKLEQIVDTILNDIDAASDKEIIEIISAIYKDTSEVTVDVRNIITNAISETGRKQLTDAKARLSSDYGSGTSNILRLPLERKIEILKNVECKKSDLTLAARKEDELREADFDAKLEALIELGLIDEDGNPV